MHETNLARRQANLGELALLYDRQSYARIDSGGNPLPANPTPGNAISGIWNGWVETPEGGYYNFIIEADAGAAVSLSLDGQLQPLVQNGSLWRNSGPIEAILLQRVQRPSFMCHRSRSVRCRMACLSGLWRVIRFLWFRSILSSWRATAMIR